MLETWPHFVVGIARQGNPLKHSQAADEERVVWGDPELELKHKGER